MKTIIITGLLFSSLWVSGQDFTGSWKRDNLLSNAGEHISINSIPVTVEVKKADQALIITYTSKNGKGEVSSSTDTLSEGKISQKVTATGLHKSTTLKADGAGYEITSDYRDDTGTVVRTSKEAWTLTDGHLQIIADFTSNEVPYHFVEVFGK